VKKTEKTLDVSRHIGGLAIRSGRAVDENGSGFKLVFLTVIARNGFQPKAFADAGLVNNIYLAWL
jgi:hypothetical protein